MSYESHNEQNISKSASEPHEPNRLSKYITRSIRKIASINRLSNYFQHISRRLALRNPRLPVINCAIDFQRTICIGDTLSTNRIRRIPIWRV